MIRGGESDGIIHEWQYCNVRNGEITQSEESLYRSINLFS